jgi:hypothetical protein
MAMARTCVKLSCEVEVFDKAHKKAVEKAIRETITKEVNKTKTLEFDDKCTDGWNLMITLKIQADDPKTPNKIDADIKIKAINMTKSASLITATGEAHAKDVSKNLEKESVLIANDALLPTLHKRLFPQIDK